MAQWFDFLFHASIGISLFFILYWLLLRQSTHFNANRIFLLGSVLLVVLASTFPIHYQVAVQPTATFNLSMINGTLNYRGSQEEKGISGSSEVDWSTILLVIYVTGACLFALRLFIQSWKPISIIRRSQAKKQANFYLHENDRYALPFSFFNHIFVNPNYHKQEELNEILTHEQVHIHERHWIDLLIIELLTVLFWFNPFIWLFELAIKQNHEYLADEGVLSRGHSPARYQALLVNQLMGMQVVGLTNNLNFALGPTRLNMMKKQKTPKTKLLRMAWGLPILAFMLFAFAEPNYKSTDPIIRQTMATNNNVVPSGEKVTVHGKVIDESGEPLPGASIVVKGATTGTVTDLQGKFSLDIPKDTEIALVASFVGYQTKVNEVNTSKDGKDLNYKFVMKRAVIGIDTKSLSSAKDVPPPPPPPPSPETNGGKKEVFYVVEDMPQYPGGFYGLNRYLNTQKAEMKSKLFFNGIDLKGKATVGFTVNAKGEVTNVHVVNQTTDEAGKALVAIVSGMDKWQPGAQRGKPVPVDYAIQLEF